MGAVFLAMAQAIASPNWCLMKQPIPSDETLFDLIAKETLVDRSQLARDVDLQELGLESLDVISILFEVEDRYGVEVDDGAMADCVTLGDLADLVRARMPSSVAAQ